MDKGAWRANDWRTTDLPIEISPGPFVTVFMGEAGDRPLTFYPGWVIVDRDGNAVAVVARGVDATLLVELLNNRGGK